MSVENLTFLTVNDENPSEYAVKRIKDISRASASSFSLYMISESLDPPEFDDLDESVLSDWGRRSAFLMNFASRDKEYLCVSVAMPRATAKVSTPVVHREWGLAVSILQKVRKDDQISLVPDPNMAEEMDAIGNHYAGTTLWLMRSMLERPTEYRLSRGVRTARERLHNIPAMVTISLSKPVIRCAPSGHHSGVKMPEHDVRGHDRHYKSGKVVWIEGHKRGDPSVQRKTIYRVVP